MMEKTVTLQIDKHTLSVPEGTTILDAARQIGINIPTLCHINLKGTCIKSTPASCRICVVEVEGRKNLAPACATRCTEGMVVHTSTLRLMNARKVIVELILSDHPNECLTCPKSGDCELQALARRFNVREMPFQGGELSLRKKEVTTSIVRNMDKCIFCRRCESVCNDVQTVGALGAVRRGFNTTIAPAFEKQMKESECTYCGQCVAVCPVGALTEHDHTNRLLEERFLCRLRLCVDVRPVVLHQDKLLVGGDRFVGVIERFLLHWFEGFVRFMGQWRHFVLVWYIGLVLKDLLAFW